MRNCWRRRCRENMHAHVLLYGRVSRRLPSDGLREPQSNAYGPLGLGLWDTAGQEDYDRLRPLSYTCTDVFVVCYSVTSPSSLRNAKDKWIKEIRFHCPHAPIVLAGTKADLRNLSAADKQDMTFVDFAHAKELGEELGVDRVMECSAKTAVGLTELFEEVMKVGLAAKSKCKIKKRKKCVLL